MNVSQLIRILEQYPPYFPVTDSTFHEFTQAREYDYLDSHFPEPLSSEDTILVLS